MIVLSLKMWKTIRYNVVPPVFIVFFTLVVQYLAIIGKGESFTLELMLKNMKGNSTSWLWSGVIFLWAIAVLKMSDEIKGPPTPSGYSTHYKDGGFSYYCLTMIVYVIADTFYPVSELLYDNFPELLGSFNVIAFVLCILLLIKGKMSPNLNDLKIGDPLLYEFYRGVELHPYLFGLNVKQLTNCRVGMMGWQIYISAFFFTSLRRFGLNLGFLANFLLQTIYIAKFFWWEVGYFSTLDMMLDRAGYYICWGCLVWVPCLYTYSSYYIVNHPSIIGDIHAIDILALGVASILLNYRVDYEKEVFRNARNEYCRLWGHEATFVRAEYKDGMGKTRTTTLLTSGFWGVARHMNYTFELLAAFCWCSAGGFNNFPIVFIYFFFLVALLVHRTFRDEDKCREKYGKYWEEYCKKVKYRLLPLIW